jgi:hypothetical protein
VQQRRETSISAKPKRGGKKYEAAGSEAEKITNKGG